MVDSLTPEKRHLVMSKIRSKDTTPEKIVRSIVYGLGFRYRLHRKDLPGKPDLVFSKKRKVIFVHGCFWHGHKCKSIPKTNIEFWKTKIEKNIARDRDSIKKLKILGWDSLVIWECATKKRSERNKLTKKLLAFLNK